jgi:tol-pal system protein YbgF
LQNNSQDNSILHVKRNALGLLFCVLFIFTGCATTEDLGRVQYELYELRSEVKEIKRKSQALETQLFEQGSLDKRLQGLEESQKAISKAVSDLLIKVQSLSGDVQVITGRLEETQYFSERSLNELTKSKEALLAQVKELELAVEELKKKITSLESIHTSFEGEKQSGKALKPDVKDVYMAGYEAFKKGRTKEAREKFRSVLEDYPENEYSDNARFWIAESYYKDKNYEDAILAYEELFRKNPDSDKIPGAMLKQGLAFYELKDKKTGKIILERLIERFPDSEQAKVAKRKLKESVKK